MHRVSSSGSSSSLALESLVAQHSRTCSDLQIVGIGTRAAANAGSAAQCEIRRMGQPQKEQEKKAVPPRKKAVPAQETVLAHEKEKRLQPEEAPQDEEQDGEELPGVQRPDQIDLERRV